MPIYEFSCRACQTAFETRVSRVGERPEACPACGSHEFDKLMSAVASSSGSRAPEAAMSPCSMGTACGRVTGRGCGAN
jgi:putative FmdB family regulatory protein